MASIKRPSTSSLRRFITSRPYVPLAEIRRRFGLDEPDDVQHITWNGSSAYVGLPEREAAKLTELVERGEVGLELSVEVHAPVVVGVYPLRIARYVIDQANGRASAANGGLSEPVPAEPAPSPPAGASHAVAKQQHPTSRPASSQTSLR
jgi:hypothetical protein